MNEFKKLLRDSRITQTEISKVLGVHQTLISQWCHEKSKPNIHQVMTMAKHLGVPIEKIVICFEKKEPR